MRETTQVLVAGGGPAGTTAAALPARQGFDATLIAKSSFPRYHIGESPPSSLLPNLDVLGARKTVDSHGFTRRTGPFWRAGVLAAQQLRTRRLQDVFRNVAISNVLHRDVDEAHAQRFYATACRHAYERLLIHDRRDARFRRAQTPSRLRRPLDSRYRPGLGGQIGLRRTT